MFESPITWPPIFIAFIFGKPYPFLSFALEIIVSPGYIVFLGNYFMKCLFGLSFIYNF